MSTVFVPGKEDNICRHSTERVRACTYGVLEDFQLVVFLISCYDFTYQALRTIIHSVAAKAFFILSSYKCINAICCW